MRTALLFLIVVLFSAALPAQQIEFDVQDGLPTDVIDICFQPTFNRLAVLGYDEIQFYNTRTWLKESSIDSLSKRFEDFIPLKIGFSPDGKYVYSMDGSSKIIWWDAETHKVYDTIFRDPEYSYPEVLRVTDTYEHFLSYEESFSSEPISFYIGDTRNGRFNEKLQIRDKFYFEQEKIALGETGTLFGMVINLSDIRIYNLNKEVKQCIYENKEDRYWSVKKLAICEKRELLAIACTKLITPSGAEYFPKGESNASIIAKRKLGELLINEEIDIVNISTGEIVTSLKGRHDEFCLANCHNSIQVLQFSPNGFYLISGDTNTLVVWDMDRLEMLYKLPQERMNGSNQIKISLDGKMFAAFNNDQISIFDLQTGVKLSELPSGINCNWRDRLISFSRKDGILVIENRKEGIRKCFDLTQNKIQTENIKPSIEPEIHPEDFIRYMKDREKGTFDSTNYDSYFLDKMHYNAWIYAYKNGIFWLAIGQRFGEIKKVYLSAHSPFEFSYSPIEPVFSSDSSYIAIIDGKKVGIFDVVTQSLKSWHDFDELFRSFIFSDDSKYLLVLTWDGKINFIDVQTGKINCQLFPFGSNGCLIKTGDYYWANINASNNVSFSYKNKTYPFEQFDKIFNRPGVVLQAICPGKEELISIYEQAYKMRNDSNLSAEMQYAVPQIKLIHPENIPQLTTNKFLSFTLDINGMGRELNAILIFINGILVREQILVNELARRQTMIDSIVLSEGRNRIKIIAQNQLGIQSLAEEIYLVYKPDNPHKQKVFLALMGVDDYNHFLSLTGTESSLDSIAKCFGKKVNRNRSLDTLIIKGKEVNISKLEVIKRFFSKATIDDIVILFLSGHGIISLKDLEFYFATQKSDPQENTLGISFSDIYNLFGHLSSRNRLLFIDACFSGNTSGSRDSLTKEAYAIVRQQFVDTEERNGVTVISASSGENIAFSTSNGGLFSQALIDCINKIDHVTSNQLGLYISEYLNKFEDFGIAKPELKFRNSYNSFVIW